ncbi:MAG: hypothetical protein CMJ96_01570 [Planctomycetes bacterium]|nr:hypothetical protein [Planctomycetota bacterium]
MCEISAHKPIESSSRRLKIWEVNGGWHCSIVGTCLTVRELRALANKLKLEITPGVSRDYQLHGFFSKQGENSELPAKLMNKLLDKKHAVSIRKLRAAKSDKELDDYWTAAKEAGDIPGPYWAILSHPKATTNLSERMFADVHMLSHLVGASNRADIRRLNELEEQMMVLEEDLSNQKKHYQNRLCAKEQEKAGLREKLSNIRRSSVTLPKSVSTAKKDKPKDIGLANEIVHLRAQATQNATVISNQREQIASLSQLVQTLREENQSFESALPRKCPAGTANFPIDLDGRRLLYVGGRKQTVHQLKNLVEEWNGQLLYHDGGMEKSLGELAPAVIKADAVVFPMDCVSHSAVNKIKRLCRQSMKPYIPLRSTGVASFVAGLQSSIDGLSEAGPN